MNSSLISKIDKARRYATEPDRVQFTSFAAQFRGEHENYRVAYDGGQWHCSCAFFTTRQICAHTMAVQKILAEMLPAGSGPFISEAVVVAENSLIH